MASAFDDFAVAARAEGFDEVLRREWAPGLVLATHTHPFAVKAVVEAGTFDLTTPEGTRHLAAGDTFTLARELPHAEHYGEHGATVWIARRHAG